MWLNLAVAVVLLAATLAGLYFAHRHFRGDAPTRRARNDEQRMQAEDIEQIIAAYRKENGAATVQLAPPAPVAVKSSAVATGVLPAVVVKPKASFFNGPNKLLYLVFKAALPDHQIFANVRLVDAVQVAGLPPTPQARAQLAQARVDFVVCNKELAVVALVDITDGNRADDVIKRQIEPQITAAGGRYVRIAPNAIPKPVEARALVCGA